MSTPSLKNSDLVLRYAFDDATNSIKTNATFTGTVTVELDQADDSVAIGDGAALFTGTTVGLDHALDINVVQSTLPTGAATASAQATGNASLSSIDTKLTAPLSVNARAATATAGTITQAAKSVGTSAVRATVSGSAPVASRSLLTITISPSTSALFYVGSSSVTSSGSTRGALLVAGQSMIISQDAGDYYIISDTAAQTVFLMEQA